MKPFFDEGSLKALNIFGQFLMRALRSRKHSKEIKTEIEHTSTLIMCLYVNFLGVWIFM